MMCKWILIVIVLVNLWSLTVSGQEPEIQIDSSIVMVPVQVMDRNGRFVSSLQRSDFIVSEQGIPQDIVHFEATTTPISVFMLIDVSGSMMFDIQTLARSTSDFAKQLQPKDRIWVASFAEKISMHVKNRSVDEFAKRDKIGLRVDGIPFVTMVYDAVELALEEFRKVRGRKAIILFSDGIGSGFDATLRSNIHDAEEGDSLIYTIRFDTNVPGKSKYESQKKYEQRLANAELAVTYMRSLADVTGGRAIDIDGVSKLDDVFRSIKEELSQTYLIGYQPKTSGSRGERRRIKISTGRDNLIVRSKNEVLY